MSDYEVTTDLDWLRYSAPNGYLLKDMIPQELTIDYESDLKPLPHYTNAAKIFPAGRVDWNVKDTKQGSLVTFGGHDLREINENGISSRYLVTYCHKSKWLRASRIDLAIDIKHRVANPTDILEAWQQKRIKTHAKACRHIYEESLGGEENGNTVYIGSRKSGTFLRVYNKGDEQKSDELWTRIELELKKTEARKAQAKIHAVGINEVVTSKLTSFVKITGVSWWSNMLFALPQATAIMRGERKQKKDSKTTWLEDQALPAVCKAIISGNEYVRNEVLEALIRLGNSGIAFTEEV